MSVSVTAAPVRAIPNAEMKDKPVGSTSRRIATKSSKLPKAPRWSDWVTHEEVTSLKCQLCSWQCTATHEILEAIDTARMHYRVVHQKSVNCYFPGSDRPGSRVGRGKDGFSCPVCQVLYQDPWCLRVSPAAMSLRLP